MDIQIIQNKIYEIRGQRVMLDFDLANMYQIPTKALKQAVKRNIERFPDDFMFQLTENEWRELVTNCDRLPSTIKHSSVLPSAFTQEGVASLSGVLKSPMDYESFCGHAELYYAILGDPGRACRNA